MEIILTGHAKQRMSERDIKLNQIKETVNFPDYTIKRNTRTESFKKFKDKLLNVIYIHEGKFIKIITVIWK